MKKLLFALAAIIASAPAWSAGLVYRTEQSPSGPISRPYYDDGSGHLTPAQSCLDNTGALVSCGGGSVTANLSGFAPGGAYATLNAGTATSNVALPTGATVVVYNNGSGAATVKLGTSSGITVTTTGGDVIQPGSSQAFTVGANTFIAAITASGTSPLVISGGAGLPTGWGGGSSGGGSSAITTWAGGTLGAMANYGTSPGAVLAPGVNAFVTNVPAVTVNAGANVIGKVSIDQTTPGTTNLVQCSNCSGSGVSATDKTTFTSGTSLLAPTGGFFQTTATTNPLTTGQQGMVQMTAQRAFFVNMRDSSGTEITPATAANQSTANTSLASIATNTTGASTAANQSTLNTEVGALTETAPASDTASSGLNGRLQRIAQNLTAVNSSISSNSSSPVPVASSSGAVSMVQADSSAAINTASAATAQLVALSSGKAIYVTGFDYSVAGTTNVTFVYGTGTNCGTGQVALTGAYPETAQSGRARGGGVGVVWKIPASNALCMINGSAIQVSGSVSYAQF